MNEIDSDDRDVASIFRILGNDDATDTDDVLCILAANDANDDDVIPAVVVPVERAVTVNILLLRGVAVV